MPTRTEACAGGVFDRAQEVQERLRQGPADRSDADAPLSPGGHVAPPPSRWTLAGIRQTFDWLQDYSPSGVQRLLSGFGLRLRSARVQHYSPDPDYAAKEAPLLACLKAVSASPETLALVFLDEMGYNR